jgi:MFS family permease
MAGIAIVLAAVTATGKLSPALLLLLTFALSAGDAFESPAWRVALPEMVPHGDLASAAALNGIEFNFARAIGRALGGVVIALAGAEFMKAIRKYERIRRRDGAYQWGIFQDLEAPDRYVETLLVVSWAEHLR